MSSPAQIEANRINSLSSTGPRTLEGKQNSRRNAISHGLSSIGDPVLPHEDQAEFDIVSRSYVIDLSPGTCHEYYLVREMVSARWRIARADRLLNIVLSGHLDDPAQKDDDDPELRIARAMAAKGDPTAKLDRHRAAWERTYFRCARELRASQKLRASEFVGQTPRSAADPLVGFPGHNGQPYKGQQNEPNPDPPSPPGDAKTYKRPDPKIGRNDYCPCGSGLKYKKCCLQAAGASRSTPSGSATPLPVRVSEFPSPAFGTSGSSR